MNPTFKFITESNFETLRRDFYELKKWISLPCEFSPLFIRAKPTKETEVAATYYDPAYLDYTRIEVAKPYFYFKPRDRRMILLHEMVHACHDKGPLFELHNELILYKYNELKEQLEKHLKKNGKDKTYRTMKKKLFITRRLVSLPFEMWNHLFIREKYPILFPIAMNLVWTMVKHEYDNEVNSKFGTMKKFLILSHMIRLSYLKEMSKEYSVCKKFARLYRTCENRLSNLADYEETQELIQKSSELSNIKEYPDPSKIGIRYRRFIEFVNES